MSSVKIFVLLKNKDVVVGTYSTGHRAEIAKKYWLSKFPKNTYFVKEYELDKLDEHVDVTIVENMLIKEKGA